MRKFVLILLLFMGLVAAAQEKRLNFYPNLAVDLGGAIPFPLSDIPEGAGGTPQPYPSLGIGVEYQLHNKWQLGLEVNYHLIAFSSSADVVSQPFYFDDGSAQYFTGHTEADVELRFVEFPLLAFYQRKEGRRILFGIYFSSILESHFITRGINGVYSPVKEETDHAVLPGPEVTITYNFNSFLDHYDYGLLLGYSYDINSRFYLWGRVNVGFKSIFVNDFENIDYEMYQLRVNLGVSFKLLQ